MIECNCMHPGEKVIKLPSDYYPYYYHHYYYYYCIYKIRQGTTTL
jgi:hypothetical protein